MSDNRRRKVEMEGDTEDPFSGGKMRRKASIARSFKGDYVDVRSKPFLMKILDKQGNINLSSFY